MLVRDAIEVRRYQAADATFIASLAGEAFTEYTPRAVSHTLDLVLRFGTLVAVRGARRLGFIVIGRDGGDVAVLHAIAVTARERGRGVGHRLMLAFERVAEARGARRLELVTADCNLAALDLFYRRGFRLHGRRPRFYERGQNACVLVRDVK
jgi:ribosomal protein S18 acetylase RimI-like enzyme